MERGVRSRKKMPHGAESLGHLLNDVPGAESGTFAGQTRGSVNVIVRPFNGRATIPIGPLPAIRTAQPARGDYCERCRANRSIP